MKQILTVTLAVLLTFTGPSFAAEKLYTGEVNVGVKGLICDFCARALEKVFAKESSVDKIHVDLDKGEVVITLKDGESLDEKVIEKLITDSGYNVESIEGKTHE